MADPTNSNLVAYVSQTSNQLGMIAAFSIFSQQASKSYSKEISSFLDILDFFTLTSSLGVKFSDLDEIDVTHYISLEIIQERSIINLLLKK